MVRTSFTHCPFYLLWCDTNAPGRWFNLHKTNAANEELVSRLIYGRKVQGGIRYTDCSYHSNSLSNKMGNSLLAVRDINHKYIVVGGIVAITEIVSLEEDMGIRNLKTVDIVDRNGIIKTFDI